MQEMYIDDNWKLVSTRKLIHIWHELKGQLGPDLPRSMSEAKSN